METGREFLWLIKKGSPRRNGATSNDCLPYEKELNDYYTQAIQCNNQKKFYTT